MTIRYIKCPHCSKQLILIGKNIVAMLYEEHPELTRIDDTNGHSDGEL